MEDRQLTKDYLQDKLQQELQNIHSLFTSCTMATIRWLQRYSHCYSILCSCICFPLWILVLPIAVALDICIYLAILILFVVVFILSLFTAPCRIAYKFSSCADAWNPVNIYRYSLLEALLWVKTAYVFVQMMWQCYCGSGEVEGGAPICCNYLCCESCHRACTHATHVEINGQPCTIL